MVPPLTLCANMKKGPNLRWSLIQCSGGDEGDRTPDLLTASQALSQLSYAPVRRSTIRELPRRCKGNFGKTFRGRGRRWDESAARTRGQGTRDAGSGPRGAPRVRRRCRLTPSRLQPGRPRGRPHGRRPPRRRAFGPTADRPPRNRPIYYVWAASPDHARLGENKTAGKRLAGFAESVVWSWGRGQT